MNEEKDLQKVLFSTIKNYNQDELIEILFRFAMLNFLLAWAKGIKYQNSFCKHGLFSISQNLERKTDRMQNLMFPEDGKFLDFENMIKGEDGFFDALSDEANYCQLAESFFYLKSLENKDIKKKFYDFIDKQINYISSYFVDEFSLDFFLDKMKIMYDNLIVHKNEYKNNDNQLTNFILDFVYSPLKGKKI